MADLSPSAPTASATSSSPAGAVPAEAQAGSDRSTKPSAVKQQVKSEVSQVTGEGEQQKTQAEVDEEFDLEGEKVSKKQLFEDYKRRKEFERASHKRMQEAAELRKQSTAREKEIEAAFARLNQDPYAVYRAGGLNDEQIDQIAEQRLLERMKRAQMTPEQIEAEKFKADYHRTQQELQHLKQQQQQAQYQALQEKYIKHFDQQIAQAMEIGNLARTASTGAKVAAVMAEYLQAGEQIEPAVAAQIVRDNYQTEIRHEFTDLRKQLSSGKLSQDRFIGYVSDLIGPDTVKAIQQSAIKQAQNFEPQKPRVAQNAAALPRKTFDSFDEANAWIGKRIKNG